jgi:hypothetical protein
MQRVTKETVGLRIVTGDALLTRPTVSAVMGRMLAAGLSFGQRD